jgi:hypothetical protein
LVGGFPGGQGVVEYHTGATERLTEGQPVPRLWI